ncbi:AAA family ATPase [Armatimonas rosea]|uniref:AAA15 family ATPase/GTPase n=1 Tax=Armatimonas rosea TaxID=685828 RepID=A0A7W9SM38_ARMRO|nr:AAA family ATPase [Armatimonas rosea]MBB6048359.1 AAA15 family ATPase/GTPase [Armatimonas rosea]
MSNEPIPQSEAQTPPAAYFLSLSIANFRCFKEEQTLDLSDGNGKPAMWTILLGENGVGKTTLLQCLPTLCVESKMDWVRFNDELTAFINANIDHKNQKVQKKIFKSGLRVEYKCKLSAKFSVGGKEQEYTHIYKDGGINFFYNEDIDVERDIDRSIILNFCNWYGYSASRRVSDVPVRNINNSFLQSSPLYNEKMDLLNGEYWLYQADYSSRISESSKAETRKIQIQEILKKILPDVQDFRFVLLDEVALSPSIEVKTHYGWVSMANLSLGYRTAIAWVVDFASRMLDHYPDSPNPLTEPAVCLVDEIDLHMHPKWQRELIKTLSETFPKTQFIVTAHSPLIVQAAPNANVALLRREGDHVVIENGWEKARNWRVDQIFASDLFDAGALSDEVRDALRRRRELAQKAGRTEADEAELASLNAKLDAMPSEAGAEAATVDEILRYAEVLLQKP